MIGVPSTAVASHVITRAAEVAPMVTIAPRGCASYVDFDTEKVSDFQETHAFSPAHADQISVRPR
jgi:hypothetical protein